MRDAAYGRMIIRFEEKEQQKRGGGRQWNRSRVGKERIMKKIRMAKWYCVICSILMILSLAGCGGKGTDSQRPAGSSETMKQSGETTEAQTRSARETTAGISRTTEDGSRLTETNAAVSPSSDDQTQSSAAARSQGITETDAKQIALKHAGVSEVDAIYMQVKPERDHGRDEYDVEFYAGNTEYDYEIDAVTGEILSFDHDAESYTPSTERNQPESGAAAGSQGQDGTSYITQEQAKAAAFAHANVSEADVYKLKVEFDQDHGKAEYEVEFEVGHTEYEYEINAVTGEIISFDADRD